MAVLPHPAAQAGSRTSAAAAGWRDRTRAAPSMKTCSASAYTLNGVPFQITTSAILPGSSVPVTLSMPSARAGFAVSQRIARSGGMLRPARMPRDIALAASWLRRWMPSSESECTIAQPSCGQIGQRDVFLDAVEHLHLAAPPVGPLGAAHAVRRQQVGDLVRLDGVVERGDLEAELLRQVEHDRHLVGAIAVDVDRMSPFIAPTSVSSLRSRFGGDRRLVALPRSPSCPVFSALFF